MSIWVSDSTILHFLSWASRAGVRVNCRFSGACGRTFSEARLRSNVLVGVCLRPAGTSFRWSAEKASSFLAAFSVTSGIYVSSVLGEGLRPRRRTFSPLVLGFIFVTLASLLAEDKKANNSLASGKGAETEGREARRGRRKKKTPCALTAVARQNKRHDAREQVRK